MKNTPKREYRLSSAKNWIKTYEGDNIVWGYSKKYSVDKLCAVKELRMIGVEISEEYEKQLINSMEALKKQRLSFKKKREDELKARADLKVMKISRWLWDIQAEDSHME